MIFNDHDIHRFNKSRYYDSCLVIRGVELAWGNQHMLVVSEDDNLKNNNLSPKEVVEEVSQKKGLTIIAHPFEKGSPFLFNNSSYGWKDWDIDDFTGIEIWNYCSQWKDSVKNRFKSLIHFIFTPHLPIKEPCFESVKKFDEISKSRKVIAVGGSDAHSPKICFGLVEVLSYKFLFKGINNYVFSKAKLKGSREDIDFIIDCIRDGKSYIVNEKWGKGSGLIYRITRGDEHYYSGDHLTYEGDLQMEVISPGEGEVRIFKDGELYHKAFGKKVKKNIYQRDI